MTDENTRRPDGGANTAEVPEDDPRGAAGEDATPSKEEAGIPPEEVEPGPVSGDAPTDRGGGETGRADPEEFFVPRDENGEIAHVETEVDPYGTVVVQPMTYGHVERYLGDAGEVAQAEADTVAEILRNHVIEPDLDEFAKRKFKSFVERERRGQESPDHTLWFTAGVIREQMNPFAPQALLMAVLRESGMDANVSVDESGDATIDFNDEGN